MNGCENCVNGFIKHYPNPTKALYDLVKCKFCNSSVKAHMKTLDGTHVPKTYVPQKYTDKCKLVSIENREDIVAVIFREKVIGWMENPVKEAIDFLESDEGKEFLAKQDLKEKQKLKEEKQELEEQILSLKENITHLESQLRVSREKVQRLLDGDDTWDLK